VNRGVNSISGAFGSREEKKLTEQRKIRLGETNEVPRTGEQGQKSLAKEVESDCTLVGGKRPENAQGGKVTTIPDRLEKHERLCAHEGKKKVIRGPTHSIYVHTSDDHKTGR